MGEAIGQHLKWLFPSGLTRRPRAAFSGSSCCAKNQTRGLKYLAALAVATVATASTHTSNAAEVGGNVRGGGVAFRVDGENSAIGFVNGRATLNEDISENVEFEAHLFGTVQYFSDTADALIPAREGHGQYRALDLLWDNGVGKRHQTLIYVDRLTAAFSAGDLDVTVGRQAITFGKAYFWNPLDIFRPFGADQINRDYKAGVDAVRADLEINTFSGVTLAAVFGREVDILGEPFNGEKDIGVDTYGSALIVRYAGYVNGWDFSIQGGKVYGGLQAGGAVVGEIGPVQVRAEATYFDAIERPDGVPVTPRELSRQLFTDHWQAVVGAGYRWPNTLQVDGEYFYNGAGSADNQIVGLLRRAIGAARQTNTHLFGARASYELTPIVVGSLVSIHGFSDDSGLVQGQIAWSLSDETDLLFTGSAGYGRRPVASALTFPRSLTRLPQSEFGAGRGALSVELRSYF